MIDLSVATYNIHKAVGIDRRRDPARITAVIAEIGADIIALQEADLRFGSRAGLLDLEAMRRDLGLIAVPMQTLRRAHGFHGNLILVRNALVEAVHQLDLPGIEPRGALMADLTIQHQPIRVIAAHFGLTAGSRLRQAQAILERLQTLDERPVLLMGDLNEWRTVGKSSLDPLLAHFQPSASLRSFPSRFPMLSLDRLMTCARSDLSQIEVHRSKLAQVASDHLPVKARLRFNRTASGLLLPQTS
ncbi:MAG: endonuclease/exonuclease/phosphatase family protein [Tabrizicola sp.]|uniref:endonuclease/exonuclease/phosphatase family protein n=1 Tax=Tabrizicola sp. TaxID=2005166 RepID=UPI002735AFCC|nr:endonuclease/exonuclease/phosphatase family protein [Tabrizicola sp.]MDP3261698.1 endonuclease/exonuclease/phosphatase family protein [Tabrizicola sp.]MDP3648232.1 endonuclease/exonuclease/phosphatase family protein [Paracoccaceae bacterium]MDZ4065864.1 endonuclease/exonuclease/phosphatase family protein [Tabrizicola sp.]